jgi:hypothetical protein
VCGPGPASGAWLDMASARAEALPGTFACGSAAGEPLPRRRVTVGNDLRLTDFVPSQVTEFEPALQVAAVWPGWQLEPESSSCKLRFKLHEPGRLSELENPLRLNLKFTAGANLAVTATVTVTG